MVRDGDGGTPLHDASAGGYVEIVRMLLSAAKEAGDDVVVECVGARDGDGETPLHLAARGEHVGVVRQLLEAGAKKDVKSEAGLLPLHFATEGSEIEKLVKVE